MQNDDLTLLRDYARRNSEDAFAALTLLTVAPNMSLVFLQEQTETTEEDNFPLRFLRYLLFNLESPHVASYIQTRR
jgi:hypothetical protein